MWKRISTIGLQNNFPPFINEKIRLTNQVLACLFVVCIPIMISAGGGVLSLFGGGAMVIVVVMYWLNYMGWHQASRLLIVTLGTLAGSSPSLLATPPGVFPPPSVFTLALGICSIIFVLFDYRERSLIYWALAANIIWTLSIPFLSGFFPQLVDYKEFISFDKQLVRIIFSFFFMVGSLLLLHGSIRRNEKNNSEVLRDLAKQQADAQAQRKIMEEAMAQLQKAKAEDEQQSWASEQLRQWNEVLQQNRDLQRAYPQLIAHLVKVMKANQGGIYVAETGESGEAELELKAAYAWNRQKFHQQRVSAKAGLIGQVYQEKNSLTLTKIPEDYVKIVSSLGEASPTSLIIVPLLHNDQVEGIIEVAAFHVLATHEQIVLERMGRALAAAIAEHRNSANNLKLLEDADYQRKLLRSQEEEMQVHFEQLQSAIEEAELKERRYKLRIAELEGRLVSS